MRAFLHSIMTLHVHIRSWGGKGEIMKTKGIIHKVFLPNNPCCLAPKFIPREANRVKSKSTGRCIPELDIHHHVIRMSLSPQGPPLFPRIILDSPAYDRQLRSMLVSLRPQQFPNFANSAVQTIAKRRPPFEFLVLGIPSLVLCQCFRI